MTNTHTQGRIGGWKDIVLEGNGISKYTKYQNFIIYFGQLKKFGTVIASSLHIGYAQVEGEARQMGRVRSSKVWFFISWGLNFILSARWSH